VLVVTVMMEEPGTDTDAGLKPALAPAGKPLTSKLTCRVVSLTGETVTM
jgi:hypothetical protein